MASVLRNIRYALRVLGKNFGFILNVLFSLALGIGANPAIFTVDYATLLAPLPYPNWSWCGQKSKAFITASPPVPL